MVLTEVKINSVDFGDYLLSWEEGEDFGSNVSECTIVLSPNAPVVTVGQSVTVKRGSTTSTDEFVFDGTIDVVERSVGSVVVKALDKLSDLIKKEVTKVYDINDSFGGKISDIFLDLVNTFGGGTLVADSSLSLAALCCACCSVTEVFILFNSGSLYPKPASLLSNSFLYCSLEIVLVPRLEDIVTVPSLLKVVFVGVGGACVFSCCSGNSIL